MTTPLDVMSYEVFAEEEEVLKRCLPTYIRAGFSPQTIQAAAEEHPPAPLITMRTQSRIPSTWMCQLTGVLTRSAGYDHLRDMRVPCGYLPRYCARAVAEHAIMLYLALARKLTQQLRQCTTFDRDGMTGSECLGRTALVVGVGHIGSEIVRVACGLGMEVRGVDVVQRVDGLTYVSLEEGMRQADVVFCALPLTDVTRGLLGWQQLQSMRRGATLINIARGEITPLDDLQRVLDAGILSGIGLDVYEDEAQLADALRMQRGDQTATGRRLLQLQQDARVLCTPHNAFNTREALERKAQQSSEAIVQFVQSGTFPHPLPTDQIADARRPA